MQLLWTSLKKAVLLIPLQASQVMKCLDSLSMLLLTSPQVRDSYYVLYLCDIDPDHKVIVLTLSKDQLKTFLTQLNKLMTLIKAKTQKLFVPVSIQNNPVNPDTEMIILMRSTDNADVLGIDVSLVKDENILAKRFLTRDFQFMSKDVAHREN